MKRAVWKPEINLQFKGFVTFPNYLAPSNATRQSHLICLRHSNVPVPLLLPVQLRLQTQPTLLATLSVWVSRKPQSNPDRTSPALPHHFLRTVALAEGSTFMFPAKIFIVTFRKLDTEDDSFWNTEMAEKPNSKEIRVTYKRPRWKSARILKLKKLLHYCHIYAYFSL